MDIVFDNDSTSFEDFTSWAQNDKKTFKKICSLLKDIQRNPYTGLGRPEALKWDYAGYWSREIDQTHRLIYKISDNEDAVIIIACKTHYNAH